MIRTDNLTKKYGDFYAIRGINLNLDAGDLFGFIGPNGAGKTTTMRIIATLLEPSHGEAYVCGHSIYSDPREIRRLVGFMPDFFGVYDDMKVIEYLEFFAAAYRINGPERKKRCDELLEVVDLEFKRYAMANTLSRGQTQRLGLARVLLHDPQVLLLDEPLSGLDPRARIEMRNLLRRLGQTGKTIIVSSHILPELADICNKVGIISRGELVVSAEVNDVLRQVRGRTVLHVGVKEQLAKAETLLTADESVETAVVGDGKILVTLKENVDDYSHLATKLIEGGLQLTMLREEDINLESAFMALTKGVGRENLSAVQVIHCLTAMIKSDDAFRDLTLWE
ncbi:MAG: ABC transporter ATP-binding protein [Pirellulaceae bacterium]